MGVDQRRAGCCSRATVGFGLGEVVAADLGLTDGLRPLLPVTGKTTTIAAGVPACGSAPISRKRLGRSGRASTSFMAALGASIAAAGVPFGAIDDVPAVTS